MTRNEAREWIKKNNNKAAKAGQKTFTVQMADGSSYSGIAGLLIFDMGMQVVSSIPNEYKLEIKTTKMLKYA
jgi:hypothetical protein